MPENKDNDRHHWRTGYTTGSCAAGAAKVACLLLKGEEPPHYVAIKLPDSSDLLMPVSKHEKDNFWARAAILKDGGDDPDITHGLEILVSVRVLAPQGKIHLNGGRGVGTVTKKGLAVTVGEPAINPVPRRMIEQAVREIFPHEELEVLVEVPEGEKVANHTLNPRLGIVGGISILGTSGIVRPMSEEAFKASILPELDQAVAFGYKTIILTPGNYGYRVATESMKVPPEAVVQMSNFVGYLLEEAAYRKIERIVLLGHIGKLIKVAGGIFHTHNRVADARSEILLAHAALNGVAGDNLQNLAEYPTIEGAVEELLKLGQQSFLHGLAARASQRAEAYLHHQVQVGTVFTLLSGRFIGWDAHVPEMLQKEGWIFNLT